MKKLLLTGLLVAGWLGASPVPPDLDSSLNAGEPETNVNARYTVEEVSVKREVWQKGHVSLPLQKELDLLVGQKLDHENLSSLSKRLKEELHVPDVKVSVAKGRMPDRVVVTFEAGEKERGFDIDIDRFLYHSKQGWTGEGGLAVVAHGNKLTFGLVSDADRLAERYAGIQAGYERYAVGTDRVGLNFRFQSYHQQWNETTVNAAAPGDLYRWRQHFIPEVTFRLAEPIELSAGFDFARYRTFLPNPVALAPVARTESSNAAVTTLRYRERWSSDDDEYQQRVEASYGVRSGTGVLESDAIFTRQQATVRYTLEHGKQRVRVGFLGGHIAGNAPLFERFALGNAETLRGWNKFDIAPVGTSNAVHGGIDYSYHAFLIFYDTGAMWNPGEDPEQKQSLGVGLRGGGFEFAVGFPIKTGRANPVVYVGMNF